MGILGLKPGASVRDAALARNKMAADKLREKQQPVAPEVVDAFPSMGGAMQAGREQAAEPRGNFLQRRLGAAEQRAAAPPPAEGDVAMEEVPAEPDPYSQVSTGAMGYGGALQNAAMMDQAYKTVRSANPLHGATAERIGSGREVNEQRAQLAQDAYAAEIGRAAATADGMDLIAETQADIADRNMERERIQAERGVKVQETLDRYEQQIQQSVQAVQDAQKVDPSAGWADRSAGQKVRMVLAAVFRGMAGRDPMAYINRAIASEVDAQKANQAQALAGAQASMGAYKTAAGGLRDSMLAMNADERAADKATEIALYESTKARMIAAQAEWDATGTNANAANMLNELDDTIAAKKLELAQMEAANPKYFTQRVSTMGRNERRVRAAMGDQMVKTAGEAQKQGIAAQAAQQKSQATDQYGLTDRDWGQIEKYGSNAEAAKLEGIVRQIDELTAPGDIKGVKGYSKDWIGDEPRDLEQKLRLLEESIGRAQSGGAITEEEGERFRDMIESGVSFGGGEERLRSNLNEVKKMMESRLETPRRSLSPAARRYITRQDNPDFVGESQRAGKGRKRVQAADGTITTDRSEFE